MPSTEAALPFPPRILAKAVAAQYCGLTEKGFDEWVKTGKLPRAMKGTRRWDKVALDIALDRLSGVADIKSGQEVKASGLASWVEKRKAAKNERR